LVLKNQLNFKLWFERGAKSSFIGSPSYPSSSPNYFHFDDLVFTQGKEGHKNYLEEKKIKNNSSTTCGHDVGKMNIISCKMKMNIISCKMKMMQYALAFRIRQRPWNHLYHKLKTHFFSTLISCLKFNFDFVSFIKCSLSK